MAVNPWHVDSIQAFLFFKCPECIFDAKDEGIFQNHAVENHPLCFVLFGKTVKEEESNISNIENCNNEETYIIEDSFDQGYFHRYFSIKKNLHKTTGK